MASLIFDCFSILRLTAHNNKYFMSSTAKSSSLREKRRRKMSIYYITSYKYTTWARHSSGEAPLEYIVPRQYSASKISRTRAQIEGEESLRRGFRCSGASLASLGKCGESPWLISSIVAKTLRASPTPTSYIRMGSAPFYAAMVDLCMREIFGREYVDCRFSLTYWCGLRLSHWHTKQRKIGFHFLQSVTCFHFIGILPQRIE